MWYLLYKTTGIWNKKRSSYNKKRVTGPLSKEHKHLLCSRLRTIERGQATSSSSPKSGRISDEKELFRGGFQLLSS